MNHIYWGSYCFNCSNDFNTDYCFICRISLHVHYCSYCFNMFNYDSYINEECEERVLEMKNIISNANQIINKFIYKIIIKKRLLKYSNILLNKYLNPNSAFIKKKFKEYYKKFQTKKVKENKKRRCMILICNKTNY